MVSVDKFFVYGGGRWREVDPASGRIDGWGRAKFLVAQGGKLEAARSKPVLAALRALAEKKPSAAKEGPQLPYKYPRFKSRERAHQGCEHQCCHHSNSGSACTIKSNDKKASIAIQCNKVDLSTHKKTENTTTNKNTQNSTTNEKPTISTTNKKTFNQKRKRVSSSSEELFHSKGVTVATVHSPRQPDPKRPRISSNTRITRKESTSSNETFEPKKSPRLQLRRKPLKRRHSSSGESIILESKSRTNQPRSIREKSLDGSQLRRSARHNVSVVISDDSDFEESNRSRQMQYRQRSSTDEPLIKGLKDLKRNDATVKTTDSSTDEPITLGQKHTSKSLKDEQIKHLLKKERSKDKLKLGQNSSSDEPLNKIVQRTLGKSDKKRLKKASPKKTERSSTDEPINLTGLKRAKLKQKLGPRNMINEKLSSRSLKSQKKENNSQDTSKELIIDEKDVAILRLFLEKNYPDADLLRFDTDDDYKKMHFYRINPLVNVERCPRIARMIRNSQDDRLSLVVFASKLGLRSVSEASSVKRYRTRRRDDKRVEDIDKENERPSKTSNVHKAKAVRKEKEDMREKEDTAVRRKEREDNRREREENERPSKTSNVHKAVRKEREDIRERGITKDSAVRRKEREDNRREREENERPSKTNVLKAVRKEREDMRERENSKDSAVRRKEREDDRRERDNTKDTVELSNDSEKVKVLKKKPKAVSKRPPLNEYSNLEDHAIVSWVASGARACSVNGNRIWRELMEQFQRITGHERTWHSLRNRYLRYILPRLGALALPPALQARLRAAAATGELKAKRRGAKRNSIFKPPTRGAFSRRPGLLESHQDTVREERESGHEEVAAPSPPRTPRYSDVTRKFAREHRYSSESSNKSTRQRNNNNINDKHSNKASIREKSTRSSSAKDVLIKSRNSRSETRNNSPSAKSRYVQGKSRKNSHESSSSTEEQDKSRIRKRSFTPQRKKHRSSSSSSHETDRSGSSSSDSDSSPPDPPRRKSDRLRSHSGSPDRRRSNRINSPQSNRRQSNRINSPEPNSRQSNRINSPHLNRRQSNRINSPEPNRRQSNRINSPESKRRQSNRIHSSEPNRRRSNRINSPHLNRRQSNRINSPEPNRRQSNRVNSPLDRQNKYRESSADSSDSSPVHLNKRKSNRINSPETRQQSNRVKTPIKTNSSSRDKSKIQNSNNNSLSESRRKQDRSNSPEFRSDSRRKSSRYKPETANSLASSQEKNDRRNDSSQNIRPRTRKLFNPKEIL